MDEANSPLLERYGQPLLLLLGLAVLLGGTVFYLRLPRPTPIEILEPSPIPTPGQLGVYVTGAVLNPGVYFLPPGAA